MDSYVSRISVCLFEPLLRAALDFGLVLSDVSLSRSSGTNRDNSVGIVTLLRDRRIVCHFRQGQKILPFFEACSTVLTATCVTSTEGSFSRGKTAETWSGDLAPINVKVKNEWSYTSAPPYVCMACTVHGKYTLPLRFFGEDGHVFVWHLVEVRFIADVSEEHVTFIFCVEVRSVKVLSQLRPNASHFSAEDGRCMFFRNCSSAANSTCCFYRWQLPTPKTRRTSNSLYCTLNCRVLSVMVCPSVADSWLGQDCRPGQRHCRSTQGVSYKSTLLHTVQGLHCGRSSSWFCTNNGRFSDSF